MRFLSQRDKPVNLAKIFSVEFAYVTMLKFATFTSDIELPFYTSLASHKINHDMLDDSARRVLGTYEIRPSDPPDVSCRMQIHGNALRSDALVFQACYPPLAD